MAHTFPMRLAASIGLLFALVLGIFTVGQTYGLGAEGQELSGGVGTFFGSVPFLVLVTVVGGLGAGTLAVLLATMLRGR